MSACRWIAFALLLAASTPEVHAATPSPATADCRIGVYQLDDGRLLDVGATSRGLRWRTPDGLTGAIAEVDGALMSTRGSTGTPDGHVIDILPCEQRALRFDDVAGQRLPLDSVDTTFASEGISLAGRLVMPRGNGLVAVVVTVHGSESTSALDFAAWQRLLPASGVGAFVFDKRGTGRSGGTYTQDFHMLARDAAAAAREARRLAGSRLGSLAYVGASQGGWVLPLAQAQEPANRLIVGYGLTVSPLEENRSEVMQQLAARGFGSNDLGAAGEVVTATEQLMASGFREGFDAYADARRRHGNASWYPHIDGEFSGGILRYPPWLLRLVAPIARSRSDRGTPWRHDPLPALRAVKVPILWVLAGADTEAPPQRTRQDLVRLQAEGRPITVLEFPDTDHGIVEFETGADGKRVTTRVADGYFRAVVDFVRMGRLDDVRYGRALRNGAPQP